MNIINKQNLFIMTLYEKLKENYRTQLEEHITLYPTTYGMVKADLISNEYSHNIMYNTFNELNAMNLTEVAKSSMFDFLID